MDEFMAHSQEIARPVYALIRPMIAHIALSAICYLTDVGGTLFFGAADRVSGAELWRSNGTSAGTTVAVGGVKGTELGARGPGSKEG